MKNHNVVEFKDRETPADALSEMLRTGAQHLIHQAVQAELEGLLLQHANQVTRDGKAAVVRNGYLPAREIPDRYRTCYRKDPQGTYKGR